eukprot:2622704-Alexandrium_andersonii.AAC.1
MSTSIAVHQLVGGRGSSTGICGLQCSRSSKRLRMVWIGRRQAALCCVRTLRSRRALAHTPHADVRA